MAARNSAAYPGDPADTLRLRIAKIDFRRRHKHVTTPLVPAS